MKSLFSKVAAVVFFLAFAAVAVATNPLPAPVPVPVPVPAEYLALDQETTIDAPQCVLVSADKDFYRVDVVLFVKTSEFRRVTVSVFDENLGQWQSALFYNPDLTSTSVVRCNGELKLVFKYLISKDNDWGKAITAGTATKAFVAAEMKTDENNGSFVLGACGYVEK